MSSQTAVVFLSNRVRPDAKPNINRLRGQVATIVGEAVGYKTAAELRAEYPTFFWTTVSPYIGGALANLRMTQEGKQWVANLYSHIFAEEHHLPALGAERGPS